MVTSVRVRSWLAYAGLLVVFAVLTAEAAAPLHNTDTYFHLRFGHEFLVGTWSVRDPGTVTTFATADWVPTQWLSEVVMAQLERWFGLAGVAWLSGLLFLTLAVTLYWCCRRVAEPIVCAVVLALVLIACTPGISMRPQVVSYVLVSLTAALWLGARTSGRTPWLLVPLTWVWTMCHGMWPLGILVGLVAVLGLSLDRAHPPRVLWRMLAVPLLSAAAALLTPAGPGLALAVVRVTSRSRYFHEWRPTDFHEPYALVLLALLALAVVPRLRGGEPASWFEVGLIGLAVLLAVYTTRTVPVSACVAAPLAAGGVQMWLRPRLGTPPTVRLRERLAVLSAYAAALAVLAVLVPHTADRPADAHSWLDAELGKLPEGTVVLDEIGFGGYLMWRFPQLDVVQNGYGDSYTDDELERNADVEEVRGGWLEDVKSLHAAYAVLPPGSPLAYSLREVEHWEVVEQGKDLQLLAPPAGWYDS